MSKEIKDKIVPKLRFPEFRESGEWEEKSLGEVVEKVGSGTTPLGGETNYIKSGRPFIRSQNVGWGVFLLDDIAFISEQLHQSSISTEVKINDVLLNITGASIGRSAVADYRVDGGNVNQHVCIIRTTVSELNPYFLNQYLISIYGQRQIDSFQAGGNRQGLNFAQIRTFFIPIPSLEEQKKIATCLSSLDELITAQSQKLEALKVHKKGLMQQLFPVESETVPKLRFAEFKNSEEWEEFQLGDVISYFKGFAFESKDYTSSGRRIVRVSDMGFDYIKKDDKAIYISEENANKYDRWKLTEHDLIVTTVGSKPPVYDSLVGRTIVVQPKDEGSLLNQNSVCLRANSKIEQPFLNALFKRDEYITFIESIIRGNANQGSITLENLFQFKLLVPSSKEQQKIAACFSYLDELITEQLEEIQSLKDHKKGLMQQLFPNTQDTSE